MTFQDYLTNRGRSAHTIQAYLADVKEFQVFLNGREPSLDLLEVWADALNHGRLKPQSSARKVTAVRGWLAFEARHGSVSAKNAIAVLSSGYQIGHAVRQKDHSVIRPVDDTEYHRALNQTDGIGRAIMTLLWETGARISEVVGDSLTGIPALTVADGEALVTQGHITTVGKGGKRRILVLPTAGRQEIRQWVEGQVSGQMGQGTDALLFPLSAQTTKGAAQAVRRMLARAGINPASPHRFRHAYKARLRKAGIGHEVIEALMGHGPSDVTAGYGRVSLDEMQSAVEALS